MGQHSRQSHLGMFLREPYDDDTTPLLFLSPDEGGVEWSWMDGPLGTKTLSFLSSLPSSPYLAGGSVSYTSRVMHLYCGIAVVVVVIVHRHKLRGG